MWILGVRVGVRIEKNSYSSDIKSTITVLVEYFTEINRLNY